MTDTHASQIKLEVLKLAFEINVNKNQEIIVYVDVGNLTKEKAEEYIDAVRTRNTLGTSPGQYWIPRREGGQGTKLERVAGKTTLEEVLATAAQLETFVIT